MSFTTVCFTGIFYWVIAHIILSLTRNDKITIKINSCSKCSFYRFQLVLAFIILCVFSTFRLVTSDGTGGTDAYTYILNFLSVTPQEFFKSITLDNIFHKTTFEPLYTLLALAVRQITSDYHVFFAVAYGFISFSIILCLKTFIVKNQNGYIPLLYFIYLLLITFNILRTGLAVSWVLLAIVKLSKNKNLSAVLCVAIGILFHYSTVVFLLFLFLYFIFRKNIWEHIFIKTIVCLAACYFLSMISRSFIAETSYSGYLRDFDEVSIWGRLPIVLLWLCVLLLHKQLKEKLQGNTLLILCCMFDFVALPFNFISFWRMQYYFLIPRLFMWNELVDIVDQQYLKNDVTRVIFKILVYALFFSWFIFRLYRSDGSNLVPYQFSF